MELLPSLLSTLRTVDPGTLDQEYSVVRSQTSVLKRDLSLTTEAGALKENIKKNRYKDILPYDQSRVVLSLLTSDCDSDYINASFIKGASADNRYIASQGPLSSTLIDFWRMIWEHDVKVIVMACREIEMGKKKCECYWSSVHQSASFGPFTVCNQGETRPNEDLVVRNLTVSYQQQIICDLITLCPFIFYIHSVAGCGRTGVICALDYIHNLLVTKQITLDFSIMKIVLELRRQRPSAVQTKDQYQFIFTAVACMFERFLQTTHSRLYLPEVKTHF
ncbi:tyrosine-protein phosphatase non-receptor type 18 [Morone saxatilis]|uniref:tyrosine-protein phosphatase non-receptor type 18 n=1 Tax=Morone saxatilis TaxID=34816 RepID=UPI0015E2005E|nr:tyrosine-protein phosphatase non-receptor type 18 [Morone saxatilis]